MFGGCGASAGAGSNTANAAHDAHWLATRLHAEGATVVAGGAVHHPFLSVAGQALLVNDQAVEVFQYASEAALLADTADVGQEGCIGTIGGGMDNPWTGPPHFYKSDGLLVIYVGGDASVLRALIAVMGAQFKGQ
jgi:hypothetical protein